MENKQPPKTFQRQKTLAQKIGVFVVRALVLVWADLFAGYAMFFMQPYLTDVRKLSFTHAAAIINVWQGLATILPIVMVFLVETLTTDCGMLLLSSVSYCFGLGFLAMSTLPVFSKVNGNCKHYKPECFGVLQKTLLYISLALTAVGVSGHTVSLCPFVKKQQEEAGKETTKKKRRVVGNLLIVIVAISAYFLTYVKPWDLRFGIPAIFTVAATLFFFTGAKELALFRIDPPQRKSIKTMFRVFLRYSPLWITFVICGAVSSVGNTYFVTQAGTMNNKLGHLKISIPIFLIFHDLAKSFVSSLCDRSETMKSRIWGGVMMIVSVICCIVAALVEARRLHLVRHHGLVDNSDKKVPMTIFLLLPQYILLGALDGFSEKSVSFFTEDDFAPLSEDPERRSNYLEFFTSGIRGIGIILNILIVYLFGKISGSGNNRSWFQHTINNSRLDNYYWGLAVLSSVAFFLYIPFSLIIGKQKSTGADANAAGQVVAADSNGDIVNP